MNSNNLYTNKITSGFRVPENYFNDLEARINTQIHDNRVIAIRSNKTKWCVGIAASLALLFAVPMVFNATSNNLSHIETNSLETYLTTELSTYELVENETYLNLYDMVSIDTEAIETYLEYNSDLESYLTE